MKNTTAIREIKKYLKENGMTYAQVSVNKSGTIVINNLGYNCAKDIAEAATGLKFVYITNDMTSPAL